MEGRKKNIKNTLQMFQTPPIISHLVFHTWPIDTHVECYELLIISRKQQMCLLQKDVGLSLHSPDGKERLV